MSESDSTAGYGRTPSSASHEVGLNELFFSTTDARGVIEQVNSVFTRLSRFSREDLIGAPHNIIRHRSMPGGAFLLMWDTLQSGRPFCAYVDNCAADGSTYTVFATITPLRDGYLSVRTRPCRTDLLGVAQLMYRAVRPGELYNRSKGLSAHDAAVNGSTHLADLLKQAGFASYDEFIWTALPAEVQARRASGGRHVVRRFVCGYFGEMIEASKIVDDLLRDWLRSLDDLQNLIDKLVKGHQSLTETMADSKRTADDFAAARASQNEFSPIMLSIDVWIQMMAEVGQMMTDLMARMEELRVSSARTRFRIALASLHNDAVGQFLGEIVDWETEVEEALPALNDLTRALSEGTDETLQQMRTNASAAGALAEQLKLMSDILGMTNTILEQWRSMASDRLDPVVAAQLPRAERIREQSQAQIQELQALSEQCTRMAEPLDATELGRQLERMRQEPRF